MTNLLENSKNIFAMYNRLTQFLKEKDYKIKINPNSKKNCEISEILFNIIKNRKNLYFILTNNTNNSYSNENIYKKSDLDKALKEYEIKLLRILNENIDLSEEQLNSFFELLLQEKKYLIKIIKRLCKIEFTIPHSWKIFFRLEFKKNYRNI